METVRVRLKTNYGYNSSLQHGRVYSVSDNSPTYYSVPPNNDYPELLIPKESCIVVEDSEPEFELHQSSVEDLWTCPRKFYYRNILGLEPLNRPSYFTVGEIYHFGVACMYKRKNIEVYPDDDRRFNLVKVYLERRYRVDHSEELTEALGYLDKWRLSLKDPLDVLEVEVPLIYRFDDWPAGYYIGGTLDAIIQDKRNKKALWIGEWKTASRVNVSYFRSLKNGPQPAWYYVLLIYNLPFFPFHDAEDVRGVIYEICSKSATAKDPITREHAILDSSIFKRGVQYIGDSVRRAQAVIQANEYPRVLSSCHGKFNQECVYMPWCSRGGGIEDMEDDLLQTMYKIVDPKTALANRQTASAAYTIPDM